VVQPDGTSWHKLEYVEQVVQGEEGLQIYVEQVEQGEGGLQIVVEQVEQGQGVCPAEPLHLFQSGSTRPWNSSTNVFVSYGHKRKLIFCLYWFVHTDWFLYVSIHVCSWSSLTKYIENAAARF